MDEEEPLVGSAPELQQRLVGKTFKSYGTGTACAIAINYIVGTGAFGMPYGFSKSGLVLNTLLLLLGYLLVLQGVTYVLEFMARANAFRDTHAFQPDHRLTYEKQDFSRCARVFQGNRGVWAVRFYLLWYGIGLLWSFASIFASSSALILGEFVGHSKCDISNGSSSPECDQYFYISLAVYSILVVLLASMNVEDQAAIQLFLTWYKVLATILMFATLSSKLYEDRHSLHSRASDIGLFNFSNFAVGFSPSILGLGAAYNFPDIIQPLKEKKKAGFVAYGTLTLCTVLYFALSIMGAVAFADVKSLVTLNWDEFTGCGSTGWHKCEGKRSVNWIGTIVQIIVLLYPMLNVLASYPLVCVTIGDNFKSIASEKDQDKWYISKGLRLLAAVPPLILAFCFKRLETIFIVCGLGSFLLNLIAPASIQIASIYLCTKQWQFVDIGSTSWKTEYSKWFSEIKYAWGLLFISSVLFITAIVLEALK